MRIIMINIFTYTKQNKKNQEIMLTKDEAVLKIKEQLKKLMSFSDEVAPVAAEAVKMESMKLKDGSEIMIPDGSNLEPGVEVFKVDSTGNQTPCEDGTYELESGQSIVVTGGLIESVSDAVEAPADGEKPAESPVDPAKMEAAIPTDGKTAEQAPVGGEDLTARVAALEDQIAQILELLQGMSNAQEMAMNRITEIAEAPGAPSIKLGKVVQVDMGSVKSELDELKELSKKFKLNGNGGY